jgi:UDP:flavonoid glycosyltransferase YjiC (YdhE family)
MARIVLTSSGSSGDVNPLVALGLGLRARGYDVVFVLEARLRASLLRLGFDARVMSGDLDAFFAVHLGAIVRAQLPETAATATRLFVRDYVVPNFRAQVDELLDVCRHADLVVAPWLHHAAAAAAELAGVPWVTLVFSPLIVPSAHVMAYPPFRRLPRRLHVPANRFTWALGKAMFGPILDRPVNALRAERGLAPRKHLAHEGSLSPHGAALALSRALVGRPPDWPPQVRITGFCFWDTPADWTATEELHRFLDGDSPVVALYLGSMAAAPLGRLYRTGVDAVLRNGARALVIGGTAAALGLGDHPRVLVLPFVPFSAVFARCAAVVHHGGIGTAGRVAQAGVPMLVVPWGYDQFATAMLMEDAGLGRGLPARRCSARRATAALRDVLTDGAYRHAATAMARTIAAEDGVQTLVQMLEDVLAGARLPASV